MEIKTIRNETQSPLLIYIRPRPWVGAPSTMILFPQEVFEESEWLEVIGQHEVGPNQVAFSTWHWEAYFAVLNGKKIFEVQKDQYHYLWSCVFGKMISKHVHFVDPLEAVVKNLIWENKDEYYLSRKLSRSEVKRFKTRLKRKARKLSEKVQ